MANKMKKYRTKYGYTQNYVANGLNISVSSYNMIENGKRGISLLLAKKISDFFKVTIEDIFFWTISSRNENLKR